jgi:hypothetical protein
MFQILFKAVRKIEQDVAALPITGGSTVVSTRMGPPGISGDDGADGAIGPPGLNGATGATGANGAAGANGMPGPPGVDGDEGGSAWPMFAPNANPRYWTVISDTSTGTVNDWAPALNGNTIIEWNGASAAAFTGLAGGVVGQIVVVKNIASAILATFSHAGGGSAAANRFTNAATSAVTPTSTSGYIIYIFDGTNWKCVGHDQGAWITPVHAGANYTASAGAWTVDAGDVTGMKFHLAMKTLKVQWALDFTSVSVACVELNIQKAAYGDFTAAPGQVNNTLAIVVEIAANDVGLPGAQINTGGTAIRLLKTGFVNWVVTTNQTYVYGQITLEVA